MYALKQRIIFTILLFSTVILSSWGQEFQSRKATNQLWLDYNPTYMLNKNFSLYTDISARTINPNDWYRFIIGPSIRYKILEPVFFKKFHQKSELHAGTRFFTTIFTDIANTYEIRLFQGYKFRTPLGKKFDFRYYLRLEERFRFNEDVLDNKFSLRFRILPTFTYHFQGNNSLKKNKGSYVFTNSEFFVNLLGNIYFSDIIRLNTGFGTYFNNGLRAEALLGFFVAKRAHDTHYHANDYILRFRFFYTIFDKKKK